MFFPDATLALLTLSHAPIGIILIQDRHVLWANDTLTQALRTTSAILIGLNRETAAGMGLGALFDEQSAQLELTFPDGSVQQWQCRRQVLGESGIEAHYFLDVTDKQAMEREVQYLREQVKVLDTRDSETGLLSGSAILQALDAQITRSRRYGNPLSAIRLSLTAPPIDKPSVSLVAISQELKMQLRWADLIGRLDHSAFLLVLPETPLLDAASLVQKLGNDRTVLAARMEGWTVTFNVEEWRKGDDTRKLLKRLAEDGRSTTDS